MNCICFVRGAALFFGCPPVSWSEFHQASDKKLPPYQTSKYQPVWTITMLIIKHQQIRIVATSTIKVSTNSDHGNIDHQYINKFESSPYQTPKYEIWTTQTSKYQQIRTIGKSTINIKKIGSLQYYPSKYKQIRIMVISTIKISTTTISSSFPWYINYHNINLEAKL